MEKNVQLKGGEPAPRKTGVDRVLELLGGEPAKNKTGVDRIVEILEEGGGGGGSSLPSYSSSDIGKALTIGEGESTETVIVPAQDIQLTDSNGAAVGEVEDADIEAFSNLQDGDSVVFVANGVVLPTTEVHRIEDEFGNVTIDVAGFVNPAQGLYSLSYEVGGNNIMFRYMTQGGILPTHMPLSLSVSVPSVEPKWEAASGGVINVHVGEVTAAGNSADMAIIVDGTELSSYNACHEYLASIKDNCIHIALPIGWTAPVLFFDDGESMAFLATLAKEGSNVNENRIGWVDGNT